MPRYRTLNNELSFNVDGRPIQADQDGTFNVAAGSRAEAQLLAAGAQAMDAFSSDEVAKVRASVSKAGILASGANRRPWETRRMTGAGGSINSLNNYTFQTQLTSDQPWDQVRLLLGSVVTAGVGTNATMTAAIASTDDLTGATNANYLYQPIKAGAGDYAGAFSQFTISASTSLTPAAASDVNQWVWTPTDWLNVSPLQSNLGGKYGWMVRLFTGAAANYTSRLGSFPAGGNAGWEALYPNYPWRVSYKSGGDYTTAAGFGSGATMYGVGQTNSCPAFAVQGRTRGTRVISFCAVGDSYVDGTNARVSQAWNAWPMVGCLGASVGTLTFAPEIQGWNAQTMANIMANLTNVLATARHHIVAFMPWSINSGALTGSTANLRQALANAAIGVEQIKAAGAVPVIVLPWSPNNDVGAERQAFNAAIRQWGDNGVPVLDCEAVVNTGAIGARTIAAAYDAGEATHINTAGHAAVGAALTAMLQAMAT